MAEIIPFRRQKASVKHQGNTLCRSGFHKWNVDKASIFDVKQGRLVTVYRCQRCNAVKHELR